MQSQFTSADHWYYMGRIPSYENEKKLFNNFNSNFVFPCRNNRHGRVSFNNCYG